MKTNEQLKLAVGEELRWDPKLRDVEIGVAIKDGVVTLSGNVDSYFKKFAAEDDVLRVAGVQAVANDLIVKIPTSYTRTDTEIAHAVLNAFAWHTQVPEDRIKVRVENGVITLKGTVEWQYQKESAALAVRPLTGVIAVTNLITVKPKMASPVDVADRIKAALRRNAEKDADRITVEAREGTVVLKGKVRSFAERNDAENAAWSAPGVEKVTDEILIGV
jgi:osmotically-inducible protein OsmY